MRGNFFMLFLNQKIRNAYPCLMLLFTNKDVISVESFKYVLKKVSFALEAMTAPKNRNKSVHISWARLASFCHLGVSSDPLIVSKFHIETHDPKGQEKSKVQSQKKSKNIYYKFTLLEPVFYGDFVLNSKQC